ncbi:hypothetical protein EB077_06985, partial [bacterium]|nr:hypothetical protein [bacterium]
QLKNAVVDSKEEPFTKGSAINSTDRLKAIIENKNITQKMVDNDLKKNKKLDSIVKNMKSSDIRTKGAAFEDYLVASKRTALKSTRDKSEIYPVDFIGNNAYAEAKNIQDPLNEDIYIDKLFRARVDDGSYSQIKQTPTSQGNQELNLGKLTVFQRAFARGGLIRKFATAGEVSSVGGQRASRSDILRVLGADKAAQAAGINSTQIYELLGLKNPDVSQQSMIDNVQKEYLKRINRKAGAAKATATKLTNKGLVFGAAGMFGKPWSANNQVIDSDKLSKKATVRIVGGVLQPEIANQIDQLFSSNIEDITSQAAQMIAPGSNAATISNPNLEGSIQGALLEKVVQKLGGPGAQKGLGFDFPEGLKAAAKYFGLPEDIPTDLKRTLSGPSTIKDNIVTYLKNVMGYARGGLVQKFAEGGSPKLVKRGTLTYKLDDIIAAGLTEEQFMEKIPVPGNMGSQWKVGGIGPDAILMPRFLTPYTPTSSVYDKWEKAQADKEERIVNAMQKKGRSVGDYEGMTTEEKIFRKNRNHGYNLGGLIKLAGGGKVDYYSLEKNSGFKSQEFDSLVNFAKTNDFTLEEFKNYLAKRLTEKRSKAGLMMNPVQLLRAITPEEPSATNRQLQLAEMLKGPVDAKYNPKYDNAIKPFSSGGSAQDTVPALLTPGEFVINKKAAQRIGYSKLHKMNKADKIQGYNKGGAVQYFNSGSTGNGVSSPISSSSGVTEKQLGLILKVLIAQEKNTRTQGGQKLINQIKDSIAKQSLGVISASEAVTTVAAGIRSFAIDQKRGGNEDRAQSLKNVFDALDRLQQSKGGTSLIQATNSQLGIGVAKKVAQAVSPSNPTTPAVINTPQTFPQQNTQVNNEAQKRKEEQNEYFAYRAKQSGQSVSGFRATLASKVVSREQELQDNLKNQQQQFRYSALGQSDILKGSKDKKQLNAAKTEFASKLKEIDPGRSAGEIDKAAKRLVIALRKGADSFDTIVKNDTVLSDILAKTRTSAENAAIAFDEVAKENNMTADVLRKQISNKDNKQYRQQKFIQSDTGQKYGKLAENAPDLISKFANTKTGQKLGAAADFASGKGLVNFATKKLGDGFGNALDGWLKKLGGPMTVLGAGLSVLGEKLPDIASSLGYGQSETAAGVAGGIAGAGQGLASGALLGGQIAGPVGALIGGVSGAIIKGITGVFNGINTKRLENNLRELDKTTTSLDLAFKKLDESSSDKNLQEANAKFAYTLTSLSKVGGQANFGAGGIARTITETLRGIDPTGLVSAVTGGETEAESRQALVSGLTRASGDADRLGPYTLSRASTSNIEQLLNSANNSTDKTTAFARANQGYQAMSRAGMGEQEIFLSKYIAQQTQQGKTSDQISKELADPKKKEAAIKQGKELLAVDGELALKQALVARTVKDLMIANEQLIEVYRKASAGLDRYSQELERFDAQASTSANDLTGNARIQPVRSQSQDVLNNISGYSRDEVAAAADEAASIAGGGDSGSKLKNDIMTSKILKDELPKALRGANGTDDVIDKLEEAFKNMQVPFPDSLKKQLSEGLSSKTVGNREGSTSMSDLADEAGSIVEEIFKGPEAGLKFAQELLTKYNETINKSIGKLEEYNDMLSKSEDWQRKAVNIRLTAELDLARALGKSPALEELNNPVDVEMKSMTSSLIPGGSTDPTAIANAMQSAKSQSSDIEKRLQNPTLEAYGVKTEGERVEAIKKDIEALGKQKKALNDGNRALEKLATDGTKAANALSKIQERQQLGENVRSLGRKLLTSDSTELADFSRQMGAYNRVISGKASNRDLSSLQTRRDAFAGLDNLKGLIPENMIKQMDAKLQRQMIMANPNGAKILNQKLGITGVNGEEMTYDDALKMGEAGKDPVQEKYIKMYQDATDVQSRAAQALADNALKSSEILRDAASQLLDKMLQLGEILPKAQESATNKPEPAPEQPQPTGAVSGEASRNQDRVLNPPSNNSNTADAVKATAAASALAGGAAYVAPRAIKSTRSTIDAAMQTVGIKPNNTATAVKQAKDTATAAKRTKNAVTTAKRATTAVRAGTGGLTAAAAPLIAANTGLSILTEGAEALYDPGAYDANKRAKVEAGQASVSNRTNVGFAGDMTSGALEGFVDPASKIVEGVYTTRALGADIDSAQQRAAKTRRMEANSRSSTYGISGQQVALANDEASLKMKLEEATSSKDDVKKAELQKELEKLNKRKTEAGARSNNWFSANTDRKEYTAAVNDIIAKRKAEAAAASATNKSATEQDKKSVETTTTAQAQNNEQKTEIQTKKAADETTKVESKETSVITVLEKILAALIDMKQNKVSLGSISASTMQTSQIPTTSAVTESQKYAGSPESPQTAETTNQLNVGQAQTSVTPAAKTIADLTAKQSYRFRQLMMKGKLRASEDGLPIGRTSAEEEEYTALAQQKKDANPQIAAKIRERELKNKGKLRVSEEGLPVGRSPEEEKEYGQMLANKPMTPYQQAQKSKREAYLARFRPEVRERMMTEEEKAVSRLAATTNVQGVSTPNNELGLAQDGTFSVPLKPQSKDFLLEREKFESYTDVQNRIARASALQIGSGPIPTSLPTQQTSTSSTTPNSENKGGISGTGYSITLDENSRKFLETFS